MRVRGCPGEHEEIVRDVAGSAGVPLEEAQFTQLLPGSATYLVALPPRHRQSLFAALCERLLFLVS